MTVQPNACDQDRCHRHQGQRFAGCQPRLNHRPFILAEQPLDPLQRDRIDVPYIAMNEGDPLDPAVMRRVKAMVHA